MLGDTDKPKILGNNSSLEAEGRSNNPQMQMERREGWWESDKKLRLDRNYSGCFVNIFYILLLLTELVLWVKVSLRWSLMSRGIIYMKRLESPN